MSEYVIKRTDIASEYKWKLEDLFLTSNDFLKTLDKTYTQIATLKSYKGKLATSAKTLLEFLNLQNDFWIQVNKLYVYSHMRLHEDGNISLSQDLCQKSEILVMKANSKLSFIQPEMSELTSELIDDFYETEPQLEIYRHYFNELFRLRKHILDSRTEALLAEVTEISSASKQAFEMFNNVDIHFPSIDTSTSNIPLTHGNYITLMQSNDRSIRKQTFYNLYHTYKQFRNTLSSLFSSNIKQYYLLSKTRHFSSSLEMALSENHIPTSVYHQLIQTVNEHLYILHDYMALRKKTLNLESLHMYDLFVPMCAPFDKPISFDEAKEIIIQALTPLGEDYIQVIQSAFTDGWIDRYENQGKRTGAYSWGTYGAPHPYILLNFVPNINSLFTLIHELGHALHSHYSYKTQPPVYGDYSIFVAEVASTVNEALLMQYLLKSTSSSLEKTYLLSYFMEQFKSTLYRQTMFAEFELAMHTAYQEGISLTTEYLCSHYLELVKKYHGASTYVDDEIAYEWSRIPHFYTPFYVYQYATGYSAAISISQKILANEPGAVSNYLRFLSSGSSKSPIELLKIAGVDMTTKQPIIDALKVFHSLILDFK